MTLTPARMLALTTLGVALTGCNGALWGNLLVLGITLGIFFGTLALGGSSTATQSADVSTSSTGGAS